MPQHIKKGANALVAEALDGCKLRCVVNPKTPFGKELEKEK